MSDISPPSGLKPKAKFFEEVGEDMINADGAITLIMDIDTPEAKLIRRAFRRQLATWREHTELSPEKQREEALFAALSDVGVKVNNMGKLKGDME